MITWIMKVTIVLSLFGWFERKLQMNEAQTKIDRAFH